MKLAVLLLCFLPAAGFADGLATLPPMGWNHWDAFGCNISDAIIRAQTDALVSNGMRDAGYKIITVDGCWTGQRDELGNMRGNALFPDMKALGDYIHSKGFLFGIYSTPGPLTCDGSPGSWGHEVQDAKTYASWGVDLLKYDWCNAESVYPMGSAGMQTAYKKMSDALKATGRPIIFSLCEYGMSRVWTWGKSVGGHMWRVTGDVAPATFPIISNAAFMVSGIEAFNGPSGWNDLDLLQVGNGNLTMDECRWQMTVWSLMASPLFASTDLTALTPAALAILTNPEVISVDQDPAGVQASTIWRLGPEMVMSKQLSDGTFAVGFINRGWDDDLFTLNLGDLGVNSAYIRDAWAHQDLGKITGSFQARVYGHQAMLLIVTPSS